MIWKILLNAGAIIELLKALRSVGFPLVRDRKLPPCGEAVNLLKALQRILKSGLIDIPGVEEEDLIRAIDEVEKEMQCLPN